MSWNSLGRAIAEDAKQRTVSGWANIATSTASVIDSEIAYPGDVATHQVTEALRHPQHPEALPSPACLPVP